MTADVLLDCIGDVRDEWLEEAEPKAAPCRNARTRWAVLAACLVLLAVGVFALVRLTSPRYDASLPVVSVPSLRSASGGGFILLPEGEEPDAANPWREGQMIETLPVFTNGSYDASGAGLPIGLTREQMSQKLTAAAEALGLTVTQMSERTDSHLTVAGEDALVEITAETDGLSLRVEADGTMVIVLPETGEPSPFALTLSDGSDGEIEAILQVYGGLLGFSDPCAQFVGPNGFSGESQHVCRVYDAAGDDAQDVLNFAFNSAYFYPGEDGRLWMIRIYSGLSAAEKIADYPLISVREAKKLLFSGKYQSNAEHALTKQDTVAAVRLVYRTGRLEQTLLPYYCFFVEIELPETVSVAPGQKSYGLYYVPAIPEDNYE